LIGDGFTGRILRKYGLFKDNCFKHVLLIFKKDNTRGRKLSTAVYRNIINNTLVFHLYNYSRSDERIRQVYLRERPVYENVSRNRSEPVYEFVKTWSLNQNIKPQVFSFPVSLRIYSTMVEKRAPLILNGSGPNSIFRTNGSVQPGDMLQTLARGGKVSALVAGILQNPGINLYQDNREVPEQQYPEKFGYENRVRVNEIRNSQPDGMMRTVTVDGKVSVSASGTLQNSGINLYQDNREVPEQRYPEKFRYENRRRSYYEQERTGRADGFEKNGTEPVFEHIFTAARQQKLINNIGNLKHEINDNRTGQRVGYPNVELAELAGTNTVWFGGVQRLFGKRNSFEGKTKPSLGFQLVSGSEQLAMSSRPLKKLQSPMSLKRRQRLQLIGDAMPFWDLLSVIYAETARKVQHRENSTLTENTPFAAANTWQRHEMPLNDARSEKSISNKLKAAYLLKQVGRYRKAQKIGDPEETETESENGTHQLSFRLRNQKRLKEESLTKQERFLKVLDSEDLIYDRLRHMVSEDRIFDIRFSPAHYGEIHRNVWEPQRRRNAFEKPFIPQMQAAFQIYSKQNSCRKVLLWSQELHSAKLLNAPAKISGEALNIQNRFGTELEQKKNQYSRSEAAMPLISKGKSVFQPYMQRISMSGKKEISGKQPAYLNKDSIRDYMNKSQWLIGKYRYMTAENNAISSRNLITVTGNNMHFYRMDDSKMGIGWKEPEKINLRKGLPDIEIEDRTQTALLDYPQMDFHRTREPNHEREAVKSKNGTTVQNQVYRYEEGFKIGRADMEKLVDNVCGKIEKRLEFDRQRRGL
jgi:hypothetical protein